MKLETQRQEAEMRERELRLIMLEKDQLLKEPSQVLQETQAGLFTPEEAKKRLEQVDRYQMVLTKRLENTYQQPGSSRLDGNMLASAENLNDDHF
jgi:hypothetical protein